MNDRYLPHLATRIFNTPLAIERNKLDTILQVLGPRVGVSGFEFIPDAAVIAEKTEYDRNAGYETTSDGIAIIDIAGTLVRESGWLDALSGLTSYSLIYDQINKAADDSSVSGILLCFDSPGGEVGGLPDLAAHIFSLRGKKPIYASVSEMACSAAYWLASATDRIFLTQTAAVGSIGVYALHVDQSQWDKDAGLKFNYIQAGAKKTLGNPHEPLSDDAKAEFQGEIDRIYGLFCEAVARNRNLSAESVRATEAGVFFGPAALQNRLADAMGTTEDALTALRGAISSKNTVFMNAESRSAAISAENESLTVADASAPKPTKEDSAMSNPTADATEPEMAKTPLTAEAKAPCKEDMKGKPADEEDEEDGPDEEEPDGDPDDEEEKTKKGKKKMETDFKQVAMLCKLAGKPELAVDYIGQGMTVEAVQEALLASRAEESASYGVQSFVGPIGTTALDTIETQAASHAASTGKTKHQAYRDLLLRNPKAYETYVSERDNATSNRVSAGKYMAQMYQRYPGTL